MVQFSDADILYHKGTISYGPAFIRAYKIENELAEYPRIVIDTQIINFKVFPENEDFENVKFQMGFHVFEGNRNPIILIIYLDYISGNQPIILLLF